MTVNLAMQLAKALDAIKSKDLDTRLAAEIGQMLLEKNQVR